MFFSDFLQFVVFQPAAFGFYSYGTENCLANADTCNKQHKCRIKRAITNWNAVFLPLLRQSLGCPHAL